MQKTRYVEGGGTNPLWLEKHSPHMVVAYHGDVNGKVPPLTIAVWNNNTGKRDDLIGKASIELHSLVHVASSSSIASTVRCKVMSESGAHIGAVSISLKYTVTAISSNTKRTGGIPRDVNPTPTVNASSWKQLPGMFEVRFDKQILELHSCWAYFHKVRSLM